MLRKSKLASLFNLSLPLIQAPMAGGATTPELVAAVANANCLASFAGGYLSPAEIRDAIQKIRRLTNQAFAVNVFVPETHHATALQIEDMQHLIENACPELNWHPSAITPPYAPSFDEQLEVLLAEKISIVSFAFGVLSPEWITKFKNAKITLIGTATTVAEAKRLANNDIDFIVAQGREAGGHRSTFLHGAEDALLPLKELIPLMIAEVDKPIIAAGGIMNADGISSALKLGADGVQMGTAFLTCKESGIHPSYKSLLLEGNTETTFTRAFSGKLARGLKNEFIARMQVYEPYILDYPIQNALTTPMRKEAAKQNNTDFMSLWAGENYNQCQNISTAELIHQLREELK